ncbi:Na+/K+ ATPase alpha subunit [Sarcoptes scabiei]|nr:Na+/K+ ATPase alpha subunit [Sarcoptes scabiei]
MQPNRFEIFQTSIESESENKSTIVIVAERLSSIVRNSMSVKLKRTIAIIVVVIVSMVIENHRCFEWHLFSDDLDIIRNTTQLIESRGFRFQIHHPITQDGYILTLIRLINPYAKFSKRSIYFQHGLFGNSDNFLLSRNELLTRDGLINTQTSLLNDCSGFESKAVGQSLAYVLSACGYDVWLGNFRGNRYSSDHILLDSKLDKEYWTFTIDHLSRFDLEANIDYIREETDNSHIGYVGHSLGTSVMFQLLAEKPFYSEILKPVVMLAPVAYVSHIKAPLLLLAAYNPFFVKLLSTLQMPIFGLPSRLIATLDQLIGTFICGNEFLKPICTFFLFTLCGFDYPNTDKSMIPFAYGHFPDNTAALLLAHLAQRVVNNTFSFFDYGLEENLNLYSSMNSPTYNISRITSKHLIFISGLNDWLADPEDVESLRKQLTVKIMQDYIVPDESFNHDDFLLGSNVGKLQNSLLLRWLNAL